MVLRRDGEIQQGDTVDIVTPVLEGNDPDAKFFEPLSAVTPEFTMAEGSFDDDSLGSTVLTTADVDIIIEPFADTDMGVDEFDGVTSIPDSQDVIVVQIPFAQTTSLMARTTYAYHIRFETTVDNETTRLSPVKGDLSVNPVRLLTMRCSIAETIEWSIDYADHPEVPALRWPALDASVEVVVADSSGRRVLRVGDDSDMVGGGQKITLTMPPGTLDEPGVYKLQAIITMGDGTTAVIPDTPELIRVTDSLV